MPTPSTSQVSFASQKGPIEATITDCSAGLAAGICVLAGFLLLVALPDVGGLTVFQGPTPAPLVTPAPIPGSGMALSPIGIEMPKDALVEAAPGHSSLHTQDCLVCHQVNAELASGTSGAPMRPEHMGGDKPCVSCHGVDEHAPLPDAMANRDNCWVCHNGAEFTYLFESASPGASPEASSSAAPDDASTATRWALIHP